MKIVKDTLKNPEGKWSRKSIIAFASFFMACFMSTYGLILGSEVDHFIVGEFMTLTGLCLGFTVWQKGKQAPGTPLTDSTIP